jgi:hypothetical protein
MQQLEYRLKKSGQKKRENKNGKKRPEKLAKQQKRDEKKEQEISEYQRAEMLVGLCSRFIFHMNDLTDLIQTAPPACLKKFSLQHNGRIRHHLQPFRFSNNRKKTLYTVAFSRG